MANRREFIHKSVFGSAFIGAFGWLSPFVSDHRLFDSTVNSFRMAEGINWEEIRNMFDLRSDLSYFNTSGLGPSSKVVLAQLDKINLELAQSGSDGRKYFSTTRKLLADFTNADPSQLSFTRNTTEGMNIAANAIPFEEGDEIILTDHEHVGGASPFIALQRSKGVKVRIAKLNPLGKHHLKSIKSQISKKTKAIVFCHVCCSNGMILPVKELIELCRDNNIYSVVDGAQAAGMISLDLDQWSPDYYAASGHKWLYGPIGSGFLYINKRVLNTLDPVFVGAYSDSKFGIDPLELEFLRTASRNEYGTRNSAQVKALASAIELIQEISLLEIQNRASKQRQMLYDQLKSMSHVKLLSPAEDCHPAILSFKSNKLDSQDLVQLMRQDYKIRLRYVYEGNLDAVRVSIPLFTTDGEFNYLLSSLSSALKA